MRCCFFLCLTSFNPYPAGTESYQPLPPVQSQTSLHISGSLLLAKQLTVEVLILMSLKMKMNSSKNGRWIIFHLIFCILFLKKNNTLFTGCPLHTKLKLPVFVGPLSVIQPPFDINFPRALRYIRKLESVCPWGNYFCDCSQHMVPWNIKLAQTTPSQGTNSHLGLLKSQIYFLCSDKFI